jgi:hypothetical protein
MKTYLLFIYVFCAGALFAGCKGSGGKAKVQGKWKGKTEGTNLEITAKQFIVDNDHQNPEDYFVKGDTIFTSFEGNQPYTKFVIKELDEHNLQLMFPDSVVVAYSR